jgi:serine/threonine protein kinase
VYLVHFLLLETVVYVVSVCPVINHITLSECFLTIADESSGLTWETRYNIIEGICYGLRYLHEERQLNAPIIHMDLKPANILLDNNMVPKIADFGMSRLFGEEKTWTCTISRDGTL